jgi:hypothetical protein
VVDTDGIGLVEVTEVPSRATANIEHLAAGYQLSDVPTVRINETQRAAPASSFRVGEVCGIRE